MVYKGMQSSNAPSGIETHNPSTCPDHGSHHTAGALTHSATIWLKLNKTREARTMDGFIPLVQITWSWVTLDRFSHDPIT